MIVRALAVHEIDGLGELAKEFYASSRHLEEFKPDLFRDLWTTLITSGAGAIFAADKGGVFVGAIGCFAHRDLYSEAIVTEELFWFVRESERGAGVRLFRTFEGWSRVKGAKTIQMCHLLDLMPEKVSIFYHREGFTAVETRYSKALA